MAGPSAFTPTSAPRRTTTHWLPPRSTPSARSTCSSTTPHTSPRPRAARFNDVSQQEWDRTFEVNVRGVWLTCCSVYPYMQKQGSGKIINIASNTCFKGTVGFPHYVASKSAIIGLTRCLAQELGPHGITVNTVSPDLIPNPSLRPTDATSDQFVVAGRAIKRTQMPEDMVGTLLYLAGSGSDFVTGQNLLINGGAYCQ